MATTTRTLPRSTPTPLTVLGRLALIAAIVVTLVIISTPFRSLNPLQLRIAIDILFFVALGIVDEWLLAPVLDRWPLARTAALVVETLALGWFFTPKGAPRWLFFTHIAPFFVAVFGGALLVTIIRIVRGRR